MRPRTSGSPFGPPHTTLADRACHLIRPFLALGAVAILAAGAGTRAAGPAGQVPGTQNRSPFRQIESAPTRFDPKVRYVKLESCDPATLARPRPSLLNPTQEDVQADLTRYHAILAAYRDGDVAGSVSRLLELGEDRLGRALRFVNSRGIDPRAPWEPRLYGLAVMMHTDAGLQLADSEASVYGQWQVAADLLELGIRCAPEATKPLAPRWYVALSRYLRDRYALALSASLLELGRARVKNDASILTESGLLGESLATLFALSTPPGRLRRTPDAEIIRVTTSSRRSWLEKAATWFGQAAALEPDNDEILLHLGRVQALRLDDALALRTLETSLEKASSDERAYLAASFVAAIHDRHGRLGDAEASYRRALDRYPDGHAARVGLAEVLRRAGGVDQSRAIVRKLVSEGDRVNEPLWWYLLERPGAADARLDALRAEVRR